MKYRAAFFFTIVVGGTVLLAGCGEEPPLLPASVRIGLSYPAAIVETQTRLREGLDFALDEINAEGGLLGKPVEFLFIDDNDNPDTAMQVAEYFADEGITAVIGHWTSDTCYYAEDIYEKAGVVMLSPGATSSSLFQYEYNYIFRMLPGDDEFARYMAEFAAERGLRRIAIYYTNDEFGKDLSRLAERAFKRYGIPVVDRVSVLTPASAADVFARWDAFGVDGVIAAASLDEATGPVSLICRRYPDISVISSESLNKLPAYEALGEAADNVFIVTYRPSAIREEFYQNYTKVFGHAPDLFAVTGYIALRLIADAISASQSNDAGAIAAFLKNLRDYDSPVGKLSYNEASHTFEGQPIVIAGITEQGP
ncbi:MAG: ABC transporter substrate-binding protein [Treponema sp.]|nr:ABC transporter substrate-binding protein [Treponema sp.]